MMDCPSRLARALSAWTIWAMVGCGGSSAPARVDTALRQFQLPDLSQMAPSVQQQVREQHAALSTLTSSPASSSIDKSNAYGNMGRLLMAAQSYESAEASFMQAQTLNTADYRWPYYLAQIARAQGQPTKALALFDRVHQLQPDDVTTLVWLGETHLQLGRPQAAEPFFSRALTLQPQSLSARFGLGRAALAQNDFGRAVTQLEDVLERDPKAVAVHYPLSLALDGLGETSKAAEHLRRRANREILPADPLMVDLEGLLNSPQTFETQGIRALEREEFAVAADHFRKGLALAPDSAALHHRLGAALVGLRDQPAAQREFEEAVRLQPTYFLAQYSLGVMLQDAGQLDAAIARFKAALEARPTYTEARLRLASSFRRAGRAREALAEYQQVLASETESTEARIGMAMTLTQLGRFKDARDRLSAAAVSGPDGPVFSHALARLLVTAPDAGVRDGQQAMTLVQALVQHGRTPELGETMAMALAELGEFDRAAALQRDLIAGANRAGVTAVVPRLTSNLARYERREPCRTPWTREEGP